MDIKTKIIELEEVLETYIHEISIPILEYATFIVEVGALTVGTDKNGVVTIENKHFPTQFSKNAVNNILSITFRNCNDEVITPKVYGKNEWYSEKIKNLKITIKELKTIIV